MTDRYAVMGNPVAHSKSPRIHAAFAQQTGQDIEYGTLLVEPGTFTQRVQDFFAGGGKGLNITVPFKLEAWELAAVRSPQAELAGAVNTLFMANGKLQGFNTDGIGLVRDIENHGGALKDKALLVLGAGGATRGILMPLLQQNPSRLVIANRTVSRAEELAAQFASYGNTSASNFADVHGSFDWVINATSASLQGDLPPLPQGLITAQSWCYDLMYANEPTIFCRWARGQGAKQVLDGLGMLVEQAAEAFWLWRGLRPDTAPVLKLLRATRII